MAEKSGAIWQQELNHLEGCIGEIQNNIEIWTKKKEVLDQTTKELYDHYHSNNPELISDLMVSLDRQSEAERTLRRNVLAKIKPYFGRIDFIETGANRHYSLYIGKNGIAKEDNTALITDWRAPVSSVYYESNLGESSYSAPAGQVAVDLKLKRTFEIENSSLLDYYDTDVIANDEFLMKYLSKNKEVVLGEIIATIQKEQDEIIRDQPWHNVIVQGVAGSGKTTVAMHRISYLLYNYKEHFKPNEFYIIGSNRMLLNYITGVLPDLDVYNVNQLTMEELFVSLLGNDYKSKKYKRIPMGTAASLKGSLAFIRMLEQYLNTLEQKLIPIESVEYHGKVVMKSEEILSYLSDGAAVAVKGKSTREKAQQLNERLSFLLLNHLEQQFMERDELRKEMRAYKNHFGKLLKKPNLLDIYMEFVMSLLHPSQEGSFDSDDLSILMQQLSKNKLDLYDLCMLVFIQNRLLRTEGTDQIKHMVIDEAQDFGVSIFHVLKKLLRNCTFTIMGDISQNINYYSGMNDWSQIRDEIFSQDRDRFYVLAKSYRNTVEISEFAGDILKKCSFETYKIEPVIRHGKDVSIHKAERASSLIAETICAVQEAQTGGYSTIAVICRSEEDAKRTSEKLSKQIEVIPYDMENPSFTKGVMVLPINLTKGLEFDAVILYDPNSDSYLETDADAKLLYVAATRALHELYIVYQGELCGLLK